VTARLRSEQIPHLDPESSLPVELQLLPVDLPGLVTAMGDDFGTPPLLSPTARTIQELTELLPSEVQRAVFRLDCQRLALAFGRYSTTRTSVLFTASSGSDAREQVVVALHPAWAELDETGVPFVAFPRLIASRTTSTADQVERGLARFPVGPLWAERGCRLLTSAGDVDVMVGLVSIEPA